MHLSTLFDYGSPVCLVVLTTSNVTCLRKKILTKYTKNNSGQAFAKVEEIL